MRTIASAALAVIAVVASAACENVAAPTSPGSVTPWGAPTASAPTQAPPAPAAAPAPSTGADSASAGTPRIVVTATEVLLDGDVVEDARALEARKALHRIDPLFERLRARHGADGKAEQWLDAREGGSFAAVSAMETAAFAGYPNVHIRTASGWIDGRDSVPGPTGAETNVHRRLALRLGADEIAVAWQSDESCDVVPPNARIPVADLEGYLRAQCANASRCVDVASIAWDGRASFSMAVDALAVVRGHSDATFGFQLRPHDGAPAVPERSCGAPIVRIAPEAIQKVVRASFDRMRACYDTALRKDATLHGKVATKLVIASDGRVMEAETVYAPPGASPAATAAITSLPNHDVAACVRKVFQTLTFPKHGEGKVTVVYPIVFDP